MIYRLTGAGPARGDKMILYGLKTCDTCRKALKSLPEARLVDVRETGVPTELLARAYGQFGEKFLNTRSATWREMTPQQRERPTLELIAAAPALMKRPLIVNGGRMWLGWTAEVRADIGVA